MLSLTAVRQAAVVIGFANARSLSKEKWLELSGSAVRMDFDILCVCETCAIDQKHFNPHMLGYKRVRSRIMQPGRGSFVWVKSSKCSDARVVKDSRHVFSVHMTVDGGGAGCTFAPCAPPKTLRRLECRFSAAAGCVV